MIQAVSNPSVRQLYDRFLKYSELEQQAIRRHKSASSNRYLRTLLAIKNSLSNTVEGRAALEVSLNDPRPYVRLRAALSVMNWHPDIAIPVLGRILTTDFSDTLTSSEGIELRLSAREALYHHFGIKDFDRDKLIEPLRQYGIELPNRHRTD